MEASNIPLAETNANVKKNIAADWFVFGVVVLVMLLFTYTAVNKLLEYEKFVFQMQLAPLPIMLKVAPVLGWLVPIVEVIIVAALYMERTRIWGLYASLSLMVSFEAYITWMKSTGLDLPCTCGGIISAMDWTTHFIFNAVIILLITVALIVWKKVLAKKRKTNNTIH